MNSSVNEDDGKLWVVGIDLDDLNIAAFTSFANVLHGHRVVLGVQLSQDVVEEVRAEVGAVAEPVGPLLLLLNFDPSHSSPTPAMTVLNDVNCFRLFSDLPAEVFGHELCFHPSPSGVIFHLPGLPPVTEEVGWLAQPHPVIQALAARPLHPSDLGLSLGDQGEDCGENRVGITSS